MMNEDADTPNEANQPEEREQEAEHRDAAGDQPPPSGPDAGNGDTTGPAEAGASGATEPDDSSPGGWAEETATTYEPLEGGGHRVTRRTIRRRVTVEDVSEEITEDLPPHAYRAPISSAHPAPVG